MPITAENITQLQSVQRLNFDSITIPYELTDMLDNPEPSVNLGWFVYAPLSDRFLLLDTNNRLYAVTSDGEASDIVENVNVIDAVPFGDSMFAVLITTDDGYAVWYDDFYFDDDAREREIIAVESDGFPAAIWMTCPENSDESGAGCYASVELTTSTEIAVYNLPPYADEAETEISQQPYAPADDAQAVVRIGRIPFPYVVTSSLNGMVSLWDLGTESLVYNVDNGTDTPSVFGNINDDATHLIWRDNPNDTLYLLDFVTGENQVIADLSGAYAQWYFLSNEADVALAVNLGGEPNVIAWDTSTGERFDLGVYRDCERPQPDMTRLTPDGTTLIIGCDSGLDIWRVSDAMP
ncbi:MAG: hypothetical protein AAFR81_06775 [Chloroflexota bacterium]